MPSARWARARDEFAESLTRGCGSDDRWDARQVGRSLSEDSAGSREGSENRGATAREFARELDRSERFDLIEVPLVGFLEARLSEP